jgi:hypothetical protein
MRTPIRDVRQKPMGFIDSSGNTSRLFDKTGSNQLAVFNKSTNSTYDNKGRLIGKGNLLLTKLK